MLKSDLHIHSIYCRDYNRGIVAQTVATHQGKVILKCTATYGVAASLKLCKRIRACVNQVVDSPAPVAVLKAAVDGRNSYQGGAIEGHGNEILQNNNILVVRKSIAHSPRYFAE